MSGTPERSELPPLSPKKSQSDSTQIAQIRGEMMRVQQNIQRLSADIDQLVLDIPDDLTNTINQLESNSSILDQKIRLETQIDFISNLNQAYQKINDISDKYTNHQKSLKPIAQAGYFSKKCNELEMQLRIDNQAFLNNIQEYIDKHIEEIRNEHKQNPNKELSESRQFRAAVVEYDQTKEPEIVIRKHVDHNLAKRVRRHTDRIRHVEDTLNFYMTAPFKPMPDDGVAEMKSKLRENEKKLALAKEKIQTLKEFQKEKKNKENPPLKTPKPVGERILKAQLNNAKADLSMRLALLTADVDKESKRFEREIDAIVGRVGRAEEVANAAELEAETVRVIQRGLEEDVHMVSKIAIERPKLKTESDARDANYAAEKRIEALRKETDQRISEMRKKLKALDYPKEKKEIKLPKKDED